MGPNKTCKVPEPEEQAMHGLDLIGLEHGTYGQCGVPDGPRVKSQEIRWHFARSVGATLFFFWQLITDQ